MANNSTGSIQEVLAIDRIEKDVVILKSGGVRKVLLVSGISFDLKSEEEKDIIIADYQYLLNSLDFPVQEIVHSRRVDIESYLNLLKKKREEEQNDLLKRLINDYHDFISNFVAKNPIMNKIFFLVIPYDPIIIPQTGQKIMQKLFGLIKKSPPINSQPLEESIRQLTLRTEQVVTGLNRIGLRAVPLTTPELIELFANFYGARERN